MAVLNRAKTRKQKDKKGAIPETIEGTTNDFKLIELQKTYVITRIHAIKYDVIHCKLA